MNLHKIQTGRYRIKESELKRTKGPLHGLPQWIYDKKWSDWLPVYCWAIEHNEGVIVVDTGATHRVHDDGYLPAWHPYFNYCVEYDIDTNDEIGHQLANLGINQFRDVSKVILTSMKDEHIGGLYHFPAAEIMIHRQEFVIAKTGPNLFSNYLPQRWPSWLYPHLYEFEWHKFGPFVHSFPVTNDRKVMIVSTPGPTKGHISVVVKIGKFHYFLAGDAAFDQESMLSTEPAGRGKKKKSIETLRKIKLFSQHFPTIFLPSHDSEAGIRMGNRLISSHYLRYHAFMQDYLSS
jgi:glyoxylase-like metal-dependent hydrolase (beta-lactamase superfamily II)